MTPPAGRAGGRLGLAGAAGGAPFAVELLEIFPADQPVAAVLLSRQLLSIHVAPQRRSRHAELFRGYGDRKQLVTSLHAGHGIKPATVRIGYHDLAGRHPISYNSDTKVTDTLVAGRDSSGRPFLSSGRVRRQRSDQNIGDVPA